MEEKSVGKPRKIDASLRAILIDRTRGVYFRLLFQNARRRKNAPKHSPKKKLKESKNIAKKFESKIESSKNIYIGKYLAATTTIYKGSSPASFLSTIYCIYCYFTRALGT